MTVDKGALGCEHSKNNLCHVASMVTSQLVRSLMIITPLHVGTDLQVWLSYPEITQQKSNNMTEWVVRSSSVTSHCRLKQRLSIEVTCIGHKGYSEMPGLLYIRSWLKKRQQSCVHVEQGKAATHGVKVGKLVQHENWVSLHNCRYTSPLLSIPKTKALSIYDMGSCRT